MKGGKLGNFFGFLVYLFYICVQIMEDKDLFIEKLAGLFVLYGAKTLTMDDIAKEFSISKKTLYQYYKNKESLLQDVLEYKVEKVIEILKQIDEKDGNAIEILLLRNKMVNEIIESDKSSFILQLHKYYPDVYHHHTLFLANKIDKLHKENYELGMKSGFYRDDINYETYIKLYMTLIFAFDTSPLYRDCDFLEKEKACKQVLNFYLDAIVTDEGRKQLTILKSKYEEFN